MNSSSVKVLGHRAQNACTAHRRRPTVWGPGPVCPRNCPPVPRRSKRHITCSDFFIKVRARSFCCSSSPNRNRLCWVAIWLGTELLSVLKTVSCFKKRDTTYVVSLFFPSMCQHHMFRFCLVIRIILLFAGIAPDRSPTIGRRPVPGKFPLTKPDSR